MGSEPVISFFNKGKSVLRGLPFLQFCKKYDICNIDKAISGCAFGKVSVVFGVLVINLYLLAIEGSGAE